MWKKLMKRKSKGDEKTQASFRFNLHVVTKLNATVAMQLITEFQSCRIQESKRVYI